jgi:hypothetical protein
MYICEISAFMMYIHNPERISFIVDMPIEKILNEDGAMPNGVLLKEDVVKNEKLNEFIWDKNFPKAICYFIEFETTKTLKRMSPLKLKCFSNGKNIFNFKIEKNLGNLSNFITNENDKLYVRKREKAIHEYIIGRQKKYYESVVIIFDYINSIETFTPYYSNLTSMFNVFKQNL